MNGSLKRLKQTLNHCLNRGHIYKGCIGQSTRRNSRSYRYKLIDCFVLRRIDNIVAI